MSLINQMLRDLEARKSPAPNGPKPRLVYQDLSSVPVSPLLHPRRWWRLAGLGLVVLIGVGAGVYVWQPWNGTNAPVTAHVASAPANAQASPARVSDPAETVAWSSAVDATPDSKEGSTNTPAQDNSKSVPVAKPKAAAVRVPAPEAAPPTRKPITRPTKVSAGASAKKPVPGSKSAKVAPAVKTGAVNTPPAVSGNVEKKMHAPSAHERAEAAYREALNDLQQGRRADAEQSLKTALGNDATHVQARELLVGIMLQQGHWRDAQDILKQGITAVPDHYSFVQLLARIQVEQGDESGALALMQGSAVQARQDPGYLSFLATLYQRAGRHPDAVKVYKQALALKPEQGRWWLGLAISLEAQQDDTAAAQAYQRAVSSGGLDGSSLQYAQRRLTALKSR